MAQHDYVIDNQTAPNFRADLNNALAAIVSTNSGSSAPSTTYANMMWYDTTADILKMRNEADDTWINLGTLDQVANTFAANILLASQAEAEAGTENTKAMTPLRTAQAIAALAPDPATVTRTLIYNGTTTATVESSDFEDGYYYRFIFDGVGQDGSNGAHYLAMDFMKQSDSAYVGSLYGSYLPVGYHGSTNPWTNGVVTVHMPRVNANHFSVSANIDMTTSNTTTFTAGIGTSYAHAMGGRVYVGATETKIKRVRFWVTDPSTSFRNLTSGKIYQEKIKSV